MDKRILRKQLMDAYFQLDDLRNDLKTFKPESLNYHASVSLMRHVRVKITSLEHRLYD